MSFSHQQYMKLKVEHDKLADALAESNDTVAFYRKREEDLAEMVDARNKEIQALKQELDRSREECRARLHRIQASRDILWGAVRDVKVILRRKDCLPVSNKEEALNMLTIAMESGRLPTWEAGKFRDEVKELRRQLEQANGVIDELHADLEEQDDEEDVLKRLYAKLFPGKGWQEKWGRATPEGMSHVIRSEYERRLRNTQDSSAKMLVDHRDEICRVVCNLCAQRDHYSYIGDAYPSPTQKGIWVHNLRFLGGGAAAIQCAASNIYETFKDGD